MEGWCKVMWKVFVLTMVVAALAVSAFAQEKFVSDVQIQALINQYVEQNGKTNLERFERGVRQVARLWRAEDGSPEEFADFCRENFIADPVLLQQTADRLEAAYESIDGHLGEMGRDLDWNLSVETGPILPIDQAIGRYSPYAHVSDDMFKIRIAFIILLNYPLYALDDLLKIGPALSRDEWAQVRLVQRFRDRVPPEISQVLTDAYQAAGDYIRDYNIWMHHLLNEKGERPFPAGMRLISHWNLRDELKALYANPDGLPKQEMIFDVMSRIIRQQVPRAVINNPAVDWKLSTNEVTISPESDGPARADWSHPGKAGTKVDNSPEPDTRYERLLGIFRAQHQSDKYYPSTPTLIDRRFQRNREMPEAQVEQMLVDILSSDLLPATARIVEKRLGRPLRPFDIWYDGFKPRASYSAEVLDSIVKAKYPTVEAFQHGIIRILTQLGFADSTARYVASKIEVDPSRGAGHAAGPAMRSDNAHLRTRIPSSGMDYKGYNVAIHELGHNVEQVFSTCKIDHPLLAGVPNTAFTEGFAFVFQEKDLELLGIPDTSANAGYLRALDDYWGTCEIAAVSLVDMKVWHWMYDHPDATPAELKEAVIGIAKQVWNDYYAAAFGFKDSDLLAVYSHMISSSMYLPDYTIGYLIQFQVEQYFKTRNLGTEMERMCLLGSITPDLWMQQAVGSGVSVEPLLATARAAVAEVR
jgi:hypothetical protein